MTTLLFAIPTWNRHEHLERCVRSIAAQVEPGMDVHILIQDDASTDETPSAIGHMMEQYPFISTYRREARTDYADAFHMLFTRPEVKDAEWVWTFGDDDTLEPGALKFMLGELAKQDDTCFIHVAEATRAGTSGSVYAGSLFDLSCQFGWIEITGFITGNITRGPLLHAAGSSHLWAHFARSAFAQSCALLQVLHDKQALLMDIPLIRSQENHQSESTMKRWADDRIALRYTYLPEALQLLYTEGILTKKVPKKFFRYLIYHLWDRFLTFMISDYIERRVMWSADGWARVRLFGEFLARDDERDELWADVDIAQGLILAYALGSQYLDGLAKQALAIAVKRNVEMYPYGYSEAGTGRPGIHSPPGLPPVTASPCPADEAPRSQGASQAGPADR